LAKIAITRAPRKTGTSDFWDPPRGPSLQSRLWAVRPFLNGEQFDPETVRILGVAFAQVAIALRIGDCDEDVKQAIANKIIELAKTGERNPDLLCESALNDIRQSQA
jgi:hypothetical protein